MLWNAYTIYLNFSYLVRLFHMQGVKVELKLLQQLREK